MLQNHRSKQNLTKANKTSQKLTKNNKNLLPLTEKSDIRKLTKTNKTSQKLTPQTYLTTEMIKSPKQFLNFFQK